MKQAAKITELVAAGATTNSEEDEELMIIQKKEKKPLIPIKYTRRFMLKKLSDLNGENLPLLRYNLLGSERSLTLRGKIKAYQKKLKTQLIEWYLFQDWTVQRLGRMQSLEYKNLQRYHAAKRECKRKTEELHRQIRSYQKTMVFFFLNNLISVLFTFEWRLY